MSIEPNVSTPAAAPTPPAPVIENEIAAYRAITAPAVFALIAGVLSVLSFTSWYFLVFAAAALGLGLLALRKIQRFPDEFTGKGIAQAGIALGLIFGLTAVTISTVQSLLTLTQARSYAATYEKVLKGGSFDEIMWHGQHPKYREGKTPEALVTEMRSQPKMAEMFDSKFMPQRMLALKCAKPGVEMHFKKIETHGEDGMDVFGTALFEIDNPKAAEPAEREEYALTVMKGVKNASGRYDWYVDELIYPYKPSTFAKADKPVDDGHGHGGEH